MMKRVFEGQTRLQGIGMVEGIRAINVRVGDRRVFNFGGQEEVTKVEVSKTGKSVKITCIWFDKMAKYENGVWVGEWKEDIRSMRVDTIVVVAELNPIEEVAAEVVAEEVAAEEVEEAAAAPEVEEVETIKEEIQNDIDSTNPVTIDFVYSHNCIQIIFDGYNWSSYAVTIEEFNTIKKHFEDKMYKTEDKDLEGDQLNKAIASMFGLMKNDVENGIITHDRYTQMVLNLIENRGLDLFDEFYNNHKETLVFIKDPIDKMVDRFPDLKLKHGKIGSIIYSPLFKKSENELINIVRSKLDMPVCTYDLERWQLILLLEGNEVMGA